MVLVTNRAATWSHPYDIYWISRTRMKDKKDPATLEAFFSFSFFSFSSSVTYAFPSPIKGEEGRPMKGGSGHKSMT